jgi:hypothetical protein
MRPIGPSHNWCLLWTVANIEPVTRERPDVIRALAILIFACVTTHPTDLVRTDAIKWKRIVQDAGVTID